MTTTANPRVPTAERIAAAVEAKGLNPIVPVVIMDERDAGNVSPAAAVAAARPARRCSAAARARPGRR